MAEQLELLILTCIKHNDLNATQVINKLKISIEQEAEFIKILLELAAKGYIIYNDDILSITKLGMKIQESQFKNWQNTSNILFNIIQEHEDE